VPGEVPAVAGEGSCGLRARAVWLQTLCFGSRFAVLAAGMRVRAGAFTWGKTGLG